LIIIYSDHLRESVLQRIEESLATDPVMQKPHFDQLINKTMRSGLDQEVERWKKDHPLWAGPLAWFIAKDET
jgi:hypothetical protein